MPSNSDGARTVGATIAEANISITSEQDMHWVEGFGVFGGFHEDGLEQAERDLYRARKEAASAIDKHIAPILSRERRAVELLRHVVRSDAVSFSTIKELIREHDEAEGMP